MISSFTVSGSTMIVYGYEPGKPVVAVTGIVVATLVIPLESVVRCAVDE